jgi:hypothetical protein
MTDLRTAFVEDLRCNIEIRDNLKYSEREKYLKSDGGPWRHENMWM